MRYFYFDIETRARRNLRSVGAHAYVECPDFEIQMMAYAYDDDPVRVVEDQGAAAAIVAAALAAEGVTLVAHNAAFEVAAFEVAGVRVPFARCQDTMILSAWAGLPLSLDGAAKALRVEPLKDEAGERLIQVFALPTRSGAFVEPEERPASWVEYLAYCADDVEATRAIHRALPGPPTDLEYRAWVASSEANRRGVGFDVELARAAVTAAEEGREKALAELAELTGLDNPNSTVQLGGWLDEQDCGLPDLRAETVREALASEELPADVRRALQLRQALALVAVKKFSAGLNRVSNDGRLRGTLFFYGAHTGRWSSRGIQLQNLSRASIGDAAATEEKIASVKRGEGATPEELKALVRASLHEDVGLVVCDFSQIEARVMAWLADEEWALEAFRNREDLYVATAERMSTSTKTFTRQEGKTAALALQFASGTAGLRAMGGQGTDAELQTVVDLWRKTNARIVAFWRDVERAFWSGGTVGRITVRKAGATRYVVLPGGRPIVYRGVRKHTDESGRDQMTFVDTRKNLARVKIYGGLLTNNVVQGTARDVMAEALVRLHEADYEVVNLVHDEAVVRAPSAAVADIDRLMCTPPRWADGLPITAEGDWGARYRKG